MKRLFNKFLALPEFNGKFFFEGNAADLSIRFNKWMMATLKHGKPTEFANKFMVRKWL